MVNLLPESAEEAKNLIPSLDVSLPSVIIVLLEGLLRCCLLLMAAALVVEESLGMGSVSCAEAGKCSLLHRSADLPNMAVLIYAAVGQANE